MRGKRALIWDLIALALIYNLVTTQWVSSCGPGRAGGRRRMLRKYPPLVVRQYIPNVSENTLGASGRPEGAIRRKDKRFKELVQNWNPDIEFRDEEKTGADRIMSQAGAAILSACDWPFFCSRPAPTDGCRPHTRPNNFQWPVADPIHPQRTYLRLPLLSQRLKEKLSTLAISVMNHWPNVKLRVIEGWDEKNKHTVNSLHYEGRAVDITTSDRDKAKYGMLARLAVEAGFDWVHYESRSHVHCSVKSEKADTIRNNGCFDSGALVSTPEGEMEMSKLQTNDLVLTMNPQSGKLQYSPIIMWLDRDELGQELFVELKTKSNQLIRLTSSHLIYLADEPPSNDLMALSPSMSFEVNDHQLASANDSRNGSGATNDINYYFYQTQNDSQNGGGESSQTNNNDANKQQTNVQNDYLTSSVLNMDEVTYTTYARNAIVGQYLLIYDQPSNAVEEAQKSSLPEGEVECEGDLDNKAGAWTLLNDRPASRLLFDDNVNNFGSQDDVQLQRADDYPIAMLPSNDDNQEPKRGVKFDQIVSVNYVTRKGIYAPLTREGNIVVNSIVASCYAVISDHDMAHLSFAPVRWFSYLNEWLLGLKPQSPTIQRTLEVASRSTELGLKVADEITDTQTDNTSKSAQDPYSRPTLAPTIYNSKSVYSSDRVIHWYPSMLYRIGKFILPTRYLY